MNRRLALLLILALSACRTAITPPPASPPLAPGSDRPIVILVSIDGWRYDYFDRFQPPALSALAGQGVRAEGLIPQFPSKTFPNHYTLVTGLRLAHHGIVSNNMVDPDLPGRFAMANRDVLGDPRWWGGEPIWNTVERQGGTAAAMFWPGSETVIGGRQATFWRPFDGDVPNASRVAQILDWLTLPPKERPSFLTLYFSDVDTAGHDHGPNSPDVREAALRVDRSVGELVRGVQRLGLQASVNYVVVSDHGMAEIRPERRVVLDDYVDLEKVDVIDWSPVLTLYPKEGNVEALYAALKGKNPALDVYRNADIPAVFGLAGHPRVPPVIGIAREGFAVVSRRDVERWEAAGGDGIAGAHGYDPRTKSMQGLFIAAGPKIRAAGLVASFENIHVYDFICALLGVDPAPNDGDPKVTRGLLK